MRRRLPSALLAIALAGLFVAFAPRGSARGPAETDRVAAGVRLYYAPRDNLRDIDRAVLAGARQTIDFTGYALTDRAIVDALADAARRGVKVRLYLDPDQPSLRNPAANPALWSLARQGNVETKVKTGGGDLMHLKSYHVDGRILRTGSANFSVSGGQYQDNDLVLVEGREAVTRFVREFDWLWTRPGNTPLSTPVAYDAPRRMVDGLERP